MNAATPVLLLTQDDFLWQHWCGLNIQQWQLARGVDLTDLHRWRQKNHSLVVIDTGLPGLPAWQATTWQALLNNMCAVVASVRPSDEEGIQAIAVGALGYCHAYAPAATLSHVLTAVTTGSVWMGASLVSRLLRQIGTLAPSPEQWQHEALSARERTIALCVAQGDSNRKIAESLGISERTVKAHLTSIFDKIAVTDRLQLALLIHGVKANS